MQQVNQTMGSCHFQACGYQLNPLDVKHTILAGQACNAYKDACGPAEEPGCLLATAYIPMQHYLAGYTACETLAQGTFFPELVRPHFS